VQLIKFKMDPKEELIETIVLCALEPEEDRRDELLEKYQAAGYVAPEVCTETCMMLLQDEDQATEAKLTALSILDCLMDVNSAALAHHLLRIKALKYFSDAAMKSTVKDPNLRRPEGLAASTPADEVNDFITCVCELIDKWGHRYHGTGAPLNEFASVRYELQTFPQWPAPANYKFLDPAPPSRNPPGPSHLPSASPDSGLSEQTLSRCIREAVQAPAQSMEAAETLSRAEAEIKKWQDAAFNAAEQDNFEEMERLSCVAQRYSSMLESRTLPPSLPETGGAHC
jgi:hypothetical protein